MYCDSTPTFQGHCVLIQERIVSGGHSKTAFSTCLKVPSQYRSNRITSQRCRKFYSSKQSKQMNLLPSSAGVSVVWLLQLCAASVFESNGQISSFTNKPFLTDSQAKLQFHGNANCLDKHNLPSSPKLEKLRAPNMVSISSCV